MADLYFNDQAAGGGADSDWNNPLNWWLDLSFTIPAGVIPSSSDEAYIYGTILYNTGNVAVCNTAYIYDYNTLYIYIDITVVVNFYGQSVNAAGQNVAYFHDYSVNFSSVFDAWFYDSSGNNGDINNNGYFYDNSFNNGNVSWAGYFYDNSSSSANITGVANLYYPAFRSFTGGSGTNYYNYPEVIYWHDGNWWQDSAFTIAGYAPDDLMPVAAYSDIDSLYLYSLAVYGNAVVTSGGYTLDIVSGYVSFHDNSVNNANIFLGDYGYISFYDNSSNLGSFSLLNYGGGISVYYPVVKPLGGSVDPATITYYNYPATNPSFNSSTPFEGVGASYLYDGVSRLAFDNTGQYAMGTGDFTIEWFQKIYSFNGFQRVFAIGQYPSTSVGVSIEGGTFYYWDSTGPHFSQDVNSVLNTWVHFRIVRESGQLTGYLNGTSFASEANLTDITDSSTPLWVGAENDGSGGINSETGYQGYMSNFRWSNIARCSGDFSVPTEPFVSDSNTVLLIGPSAPVATSRVISLSRILNLPFPLGYIVDKRKPFGISSLLKTGLYINK